MKMKLLVLTALTASMVGCGGGGGGGSSTGSGGTVASSVASSVTVSSVASSSVASSVASSKATPIPVQKTSYLNFKNSGEGPQTMPTGIGFVANEEIRSGFSFGDFFQDGTIAMVAATNNFTGVHLPDGTQFFPNAGRVYFFHTDGHGGWVDRTAELLNDQTGCITPRKAVVADFNGDGKPDVFLSCHGIDAFPVPTGYTEGEHPRFLMSSNNGTYTNVDAGFNCYCHGATAAEMNEAGYADIIVTDQRISKQPTLLRNNHGTFTLDKTTMPTSLTPYLLGGIWQARSYFSIELLDINGDGKYDLVAMGVSDSSHTADSKIFTNDGNNNFTDARSTTLPIDPIYINPLDVTLVNGTLYVYSVDSLYTHIAITKMDATTLSVLATETYSMVGNYDIAMWLLPKDGKIYDANILSLISAPL